MSDQDQILNKCGCCEGIKRLTPVSTENLPGLDAIAYRVGTHGSFLETMLSGLSEEPGLSELTTRETDDPVIGLLDAWSTVLDVVTFYQERIINEGFLRSALERRSVLELARHISYKLRPGVAAGTFLAFQMEEAQGAPSQSIIPSGTKAQSIPGQNQLPQVFETIEEILAKKELNILKPQSSKIKIPGYGDKEIYLEGILTNLKPGDALLMIGAERIADKGSERWDFRRIKEVTTDPDLNRTRVTWEDGLGWHIFNRKVLPAEKDFQVFAFRQRAFLFGYNAPDIRFVPSTFKTEYLYTERPGKNSKRIKIDIDEPEWTDLNLASISNTTEGKEIETIYLDNLYTGIPVGSWLVMVSPEPSSYEEVYKVTYIEESLRKEFTLVSKSTAVTLEGENLRKKFNKRVRDTIVYTKSEELKIAEAPVTDPVEGCEITLDKLFPELPEKRTIIISGKRIRVRLSDKARPLLLKSSETSEHRYMSGDDSYIVLKTPEKDIENRFTWVLKDKNGFIGTAKASFNQLSIFSTGKDDETVSEINCIEKVITGSDPTTIILQKPLVSSFDRNTVSIYANVAKATHGETKNEILGSGNGAEVFQRFELKQKPLTYISSSAASGICSTLSIRVNDILWKEVQTLYGCSPEDRVYAVRIADDGKVTVQFGDGITGTLLPSGVDNIRASFRVGTGFEGQVDAGQISQLMTRPLGVKEVRNPLPPSGADNPETLDKARRNAPFTVLAMDRLVSLQDFEDFTRAFAGIGKTRADIVWQGEERIVLITIAAADGSIVPETSELYINLINAIDLARHNNYRVKVGSYRPVTFTVKAGILIDNNYIEENVLRKVTETLKQSYAFENRDFGQVVTPGEVISIIQKVPGVIAVDLDELNGIDPFSREYFCLRPEIPQGKNIQPAQLLTIDKNGITISKKSLQVR